MSYLKAILLSVVSIGIWQVATADEDAGTLFVGAASGIQCVPGTALPIYYGFGSHSFGSYSPTGLTGGETVVVLTDPGVCPGDSYVQISGFSVDPGQKWLSSVKCGSITNFGSSATYYYTSGNAYWFWSTKFGFASKYMSNVGCTIAHN